MAKHGVGFPGGCEYWKAPRRGVCQFSYRPPATPFASEVQEYFRKKIDPEPDHDPTGCCGVRYGKAWRQVPRGV